MRNQMEYLKQIREDEMFQKNISYLSAVKEKLQKDHVILLKLLQTGMYVMICVMLDVKNFWKK